MVQMFYNCVLAKSIKFLNKNISTAFAATLVLAIFTGCSSETAEILKGTVSYHKKNYRSAVASFTQAADSATEKNNEIFLNFALYDLGTAYTMLGENESAMEKFNSIAEDAPDSVRYAAFYNAGVIAHRNSDFDEAQKYFRKALEINSSSIEAKINFELSMAQVSMKGKQNESQAIQASQPQTEENPQDMEKAIFQHIKENDQKQWKNSESSSDVNLAEDF